MKVELNLNNDKELRAYIKQLINNEIVNIAREQITKTVNEQLERKIEKNTVFDTFVEKAIKEAIEKRIFEERGKYQYYNSTRDSFSNQLQELFKKEIVQIRESLKDELIKVIIYMLKEGT